LNHRDGSKSSDKSAAVLFAVLDDDGIFEEEKLRVRLGLTPATLYRHLSALVSSGLLMRVRRGQYCPGPSLLKQTERFSLNDILARAGRVPLRRLSDNLSVTAHLGILETHMVTYLVKVSAGDESVFTREDGQLEAYCSGIGKILLAALPDEELDRYLGDGPFPGLTARTITDPCEMLQEFERIRAQGFALDEGEIDDRLYCVAVPVYGRRGDTLAGLSISAAPGRLPPVQTCLAALHETSSRLSTLF